MEVSSLSLPPPFKAVPLAGDQVPLAAARDAAQVEGADSMGGLFFAQRPDRFELAMILAPERPLDAALPVLYPLHLGLCGALGALLPAQSAVQFGWPDRVYLNGALCGAVAFDVPNHEAGADIPWMTLGITLALMGLPGDRDPGRARDRTTFFDEGAGDIAPNDIIQAFTRYFLSWLTKWEDDGLAPLWEAWRGRALGYDEDVAFPGSTGAVVGSLSGLSECGDVQIKTDAGMVTLPLADVLARRGWTLAQQA